MCVPLAFVWRRSLTLPQIEATDKSASIRISFADGAAAEDLSRKLRGVTVKIKGVKLHAFVRVSALYPVIPSKDVGVEHDFMVDSFFYCFVMQNTPTGDSGDGCSCP